MANINEFYEDQKDCADMLGVSIEDYQRDLNHIKLPTNENKANNYSFDNSILDYLGLDEECLKKQKKEV